MNRRFYIYIFKIHMYVSNYLFSITNIYVVPTIYGFQYILLLSLGRRRLVMSACRHIPSNSMQCETPYRLNCICSNAGSCIRPRNNKAMEGGWGGHLIVTYGPYGYISLVYINILTGMVWLPCKLLMAVWASAWVLNLTNAQPIR